MYISGLTSGIDTSEIISELMSLERVSVDKIEIKQNKLSKKKEIYNDISGRLNNLKNIANGLKSDSDFNLYKVSYTEQSVIQWSMADSVVPASYSVMVNNLATAHTISSDRQDSSSEALGLTAGTIQINGVSVEIDELDSLTSIRDKINNSEGTGVRATIVDNVLRIQSVSTGAENVIELVDSSSILVDLGILNGDLSIKNELIAAGDASMTIDGQNITSSSNTITGVVDGATIQLLKAGSTDVTVERDISAIAGKIKNFINQYNSAIDLIYSKVTEKRIYPVETESDMYAGLVNGDITLNNIRYTLNDLFANTVSGLEESFNSLSSIGITKSSFSSTGSNTDMLAGKLIVDDAKLNEAITGNFEAVRDIFTKNNGVEGLENEDYGIGVRINNYLYAVTSNTGGILKSRSSGFEKEISMLEKQIETIEARLDAKEESLVRKFAAMESALNSSNTQISWIQSYMSTF